MQFITLSKNIMVSVPCICLFPKLFKRFAQTLKKYSGNVEISTRNKGLNFRVGLDHSLGQEFFKGFSLYYGTHKEY